MRAVCAACALLASVFVATPSRSVEYRVGAGDVLSVTFIGNGTNYTVPVETDGTAWFPIIGAVPVAGLTMTELRAQAADAYSLSSISFDQDVPARLLHPEQVQIGVAEYRPVYIDGAIDPPAVVEFRPGLTVRQALTVAGSRQASSATPSSRATERIESLIYELARIKARIWRLRTILGDATPQEFEEAFASRPAPVREFASLELSLLSDLEDDQVRRREVVESGIARAESRIQALITQKDNEEEVRRQDDEIAQNLVDLSERGLAPASRIAEARRAALTSATRVLQLDVQIENARERLAELQIEAEELTDPADAEAWSVLADQLALYYEIAAELAALRTSTFVAEDDPSPTAVVITRASGETIETTVDESPPLLPGDVVELRPADTVRPYGLGAEASQS